MNIEEAIKYIKNDIECDKDTRDWFNDKNNTTRKQIEESIDAYETLLTAYEKEKEKNKKAIDFINQRKKIVNKDMAEGTRLQVGTFMWQVNELLEILKEE